MRLREGDDGDVVAHLQNLLVGRGYTVEVTGTFDSTTVAVVRAFQRENGLPADGVVGDSTWAALTEDERAAAATGQRPVRVDLANVQSPVAWQLKRPLVRHLLFHFTAGSGARAFLGQLRPQVTMADRPTNVVPDPLLNVGLTFSGLTALEVDADHLSRLDAVYREGPDGRRLGDPPGTSSDPQTWWEGQFSTRDLHCIVHLHVYTDDALAQASAQVLTLATQTGARQLRARRDGTELDAQSLGDGRIHFGYRDGIAQPDVNWDDALRRPGQVDFRNFLLGYATDEYGSAPSSGSAADFVRDSAYVAFRWIYQDVAAFNRFLRTTARQLFRDLPAGQAEELLAAKLMGRWRTGAPLVLSPDGPAPWMSRRDDFGYRDDPFGYRCPFSSHIRVVNPRDQQLDPVFVDGVPRLLRRGMPYGPPLDGTEDDGADRGLLGIFICSDLKRQFYTLTAWIKQNNFSPVYDANRRVQDAVVGNRGIRGAAREFVVLDRGGTRRVPSLPDFVRTKGTAFLLYPSGTALDRLAAGR